MHCPPESFECRYYAPSTLCVANTELAESGKRSYIPRKAIISASLLTSFVALARTLDFSCHFFINRGIVRSGNRPFGELSVGELSGRGNVRSGNCPVGEMSGRGIVRSGSCPVGELSVGEFSVGEWSVGELSVGELSGYPSS